MVEIEEVDAGGSSSGGRSGAAYAPTHDTRILVYPIYLNSKVTLQGGRRLAQKFCVEHPSLQEIMDVLGHLGFEYQIEDKIYPRNITQRGRIRVKLFEPGTKEPVVADITSRMELLKRIGAEIPASKIRLLNARRTRSNCREKTGRAGLITRVFRARSTIFPMCRDPENACFLPERRMNNSIPCCKNNTGKKIVTV